MKPSTINRNAFAMLDYKKSTAMADKEFYENRLRGMLEVSGIPVRAAYVPEEVRQLLNIAGCRFTPWSTGWLKTIRLSVRGLESWLFSIETRFVPGVCNGKK